MARIQKAGCRGGKKASDSCSSRCGLSWEFVGNAESQTTGLLNPSGLLGCVALVSEDLTLGLAGPATAASHWTLALPPAPSWACSAGASSSQGHAQLTTLHSPFCSPPLLVTFKAFGFPELTALGKHLTAVSLSGTML